MTTTQKFSSSDPTCAILNFVGAECLRAFVPLSTPMDVIVCLTITYIAKESLLAPVPEGWEEQEDNGDPFYLQIATGKTQWEHPEDEKYRLKFKKELEKANVKSDNDKTTIEPSTTKKKSAVDQDWDDWDDEAGGDTGNEALSNELGWFVHRLHLGLGGGVNDPLNGGGGDDDLASNDDQKNRVLENLTVSNDGVGVGDDGEDDDGLHGLGFVSGRDMEVLQWSLQIYNLK